MPPHFDVRPLLQYFTSTEYLEGTSIDSDASKLVPSSLVDIPVYVHQETNFRVWRWVFELTDLSDGDSVVVLLNVGASALQEFVAAFARCWDPEAWAKVLSDLFDLSSPTSPLGVTARARHVVSLDEIDETTHEETSETPTLTPVGSESGVSDGTNRLDFLDSPAHNIRNASARVVDLDDGRDAHSLLLPISIPRALMASSSDNVEKLEHRVFAFPGFLGFSEHEWFGYVKDALKRYVQRLRVTSVAIGQESSDIWQNLQGESRKNRAADFYTFGKATAEQLLSLGLLQDAENLLLSLTNAAPKGSTCFQVLPVVQTVVAVLASRGKLAAAASFSHWAVKGSRETLGEDSTCALLSSIESSWILASAGKVFKAKTFIQTALGKLSDRLPLTSAALNRAKYILGCVMVMNGEHVAAEGVQHDAFKAIESCRGMWHPDTSDSLCNLLGTLVRNGRVSQATQLCDDFLKRCDAYLCPQTSTRNSVLRWSAKLCEEQGLFARSEQILDTLLADAAKETKENMSLENRTQTLLDIGCFYHRRGRLCDAEKSLREAWSLTAETSVHPPPVILQATIALASLVEDKGGFEEAETLRREALVFCERQLGPMHTDTLTNNFALAQLLFLKGNLSKAEPLYCTTLRGSLAYYGSGQPELAILVAKVARALTTCGAYALPLMRELIGEAVTKLWQESPQALGCVSRLASILSSKGEQLVSSNFLRWVLDCLDALKTEENAAYHLVVFSLGEILAAQKKFAQAELLQRQAYHGLTTKAGVKRAETLACMKSFPSLLYKLGKNAEAESLFEKVVAVYSEWFGPTHRSTLDCTANLAAVLQALGKNEEALAKYEELYAIQSELTGPASLEALKCKSKVAAVFHTICHFDKAEQAYREILKEMASEHALESFDAVQIMCDFASLQRDMNKSEAAETLLRGAYFGCGVNGAFDSDETLAIAAGVIDALAKHSHFDEAEKLSSRLIHAAERYSGPSSQETLAAMNQYVKLLQRQGRREEVIELLRVVVRRRSVHNGETCIETLYSMGDLAVVLIEHGNMTEAEPLLRQVSKGFSEIFGSMDAKTLDIKQKLACALEKLGQHQEAETLTRSILEAKESVLGAEHLDTLQTVCLLACMLESAGGWKEAEVLWKRAVTGQEGLLGSAHQQTLSSVSRLINMFEGRKKFQQAIQLCRKTVEVMKLHFGTHHLDTIKSLSNLACLLEAHGKLQEAEDAYKEAQTLLETQVGKNHPTALENGYRLGLVFEARNKHDQAEGIYRQVLHGYQVNLGEQHPDTLGVMYHLACTLRTQEKFNEAEILFRRELAGCTAAHGDSADITRCSRRNLDCMENEDYHVPVPSGNIAKSMIQDGASMKLQNKSSHAVFEREDLVLRAGICTCRVRNSS